uniref:Uncharacterized protein n=1 Tax=Arundo donax TaxID=35708 RepID=A0A0A9F263_ARUDO
MRRSTSAAAGRYSAAHQEQQDECVRASGRFGCGAPLPQFPSAAAGRLSQPALWWGRRFACCC